MGEDGVGGVEKYPHQIEHFSICDASCFLVWLLLVDMKTNA